MENGNEKTRKVFAHSPNKAGHWHDLRKHLQEVARLAKEFACKFQSEDIAYWTGFLHDVGKAHPAFQEYLKQCATEPEKKHRGPDHKGAGALLAAQKLEFIVFLIAGHHGGIPNKADLKTWLREKIATPQTQEAIAIAIGNGLFNSVVPDLAPPSFVAKSKDPLVCEFYLRMLFSALVDADFLDTEAHFEEDKSSSRGCTRAVAELWTWFKEDQKKLLGKGNEKLKRIRDEIYANCIDTAVLEPGFFRLTVPTGGGKTRSVMAFALNHAIRHGKDRVIVTIPYTSIIEQTADVYREIFDQLDKNIVLEHHSAVNATNGDEADDGTTWARLASENWDAPVIVTTTVQLFESLFSNRTGRCRKLHNIANSVVVLDEVQTLPSQLLSPILDVLRQLVSHYGVSVVMCTATQPALDSSPYLQGIDNVREIIPDPSRLFKELKRVDYVPIARTETWEWSRVADEMQGETQSLAIVNTKKDAIALLKALDDEHALHLSTLLCGSHRRDVLRKVREALDAGEPCRLVATQVVEAGVDIDFPVVLRAVGPLDRIVQAAGRCNREGRLLENGRMIVFNPAEGNVPKGDYRTGTDTACGLMGVDGFDFNDPSVYETYFKRLYQAVNTDVPKIQELRKNFCYKDVSDSFQFIKDVSVPVVVRYRGLDGQNNEVDKILSNARYMQPLVFMRKLQPYIVNINGYLLQQYQREGLVKELFSGLWEWLGSYDSVTGLIATAIAPEFLVVSG